MPVEAIHSEITQINLDQMIPKKLVKEGNKLIPVLTVLTDDGQASEVIINKPQFYIGRSHDADLVIDKPNTSRFHSFIAFDNFHSQSGEPVCMIEDNESRNGTFLNGERLTKAKRLNHGDRIVIGNTILGYLLRREWEMEANRKIAEVMQKRGNKTNKGRVSCDLDATLKILVPDETFTPRAIHGLVKDIDQGGLRLVTSEITKDFWLLLIRKKAFIRTELHLDSIDLNLKGRMAWSHYDTKAAVPACIMGIEFLEVNGETGEKISAALERLGIPLTPAGKSADDFLHEELAEAE
ncbi:MAG: FHA domain-containing protein [Sumerlaeia bacterium]